MIDLRLMRPEDILGVVALQREAFPPPFDPELLWKPEHLVRHLELLPVAQWIALDEDTVVGSCSNTRIAEDAWLDASTWDGMVGGYKLDRFDPQGSILFGLDLSIHPSYRRQGLGRRLYEQRYAYVREHALRRYGTVCRIPDYTASGVELPEAYVKGVVRGERTDRTLTPLLSYGLRYVEVIREFMDDPESSNAAARLEWTA